MNKLNLPENLVRLRHEKKLTQEELADFMGVTKASVSKWEKGQNTPDLLLLPQLAAFYDVTVDELIVFAVSWHFVLESLYAGKDAGAGQAAFAGGGVLV